MLLSSCVITFIGGKRKKEKSCVVYVGWVNGRNDTPPARPPLMAHSHYKSTFYGCVVELHFQFDANTIHRHHHRCPTTTITTTTIATATTTTTSKTTIFCACVRFGFVAAMGGHDSDSFTTAARALLTSDTYDILWMSILLSLPQCSIAPSWVLVCLCVRCVWFVALVLFACMHAS